MRWVSLAALLLLAGCEKSFDERYENAEKKISDQAASIDKELAMKASEAAMASSAPDKDAARAVATSPRTD